MDHGLYFTMHTNTNPILDTLCSSVVINALGMNFFNRFGAIVICRQNEIVGHFTAAFTYNCTHSLITVSIHMGKLFFMHLIYHSLQKNHNTQRKNTFYI